MKIMIMIMNILNLLKKILNNTEIKEGFVIGHLLSLSNSSLQSNIVQASEDEIILNKNQYNEYKEHSDGYFKKEDNDTDIYIRLKSNLMDYIKIEKLSVRPVIYEKDKVIIKEAIPNTNTNP